MHFAANALVGESMENPSKYFRNNVCGGLNLLDAMLAVGCRRFVFSSTCATFGPPERLPIDETLPQRPINPYGESKLMFEGILRWYDADPRLEVRGAALLQRRRRLERFGEDHRCETHLIPNVLKVALGQKRTRGDLRHRLRNAGWHLRPRLHPHPRSRPGSHARARSAARVRFTISAPAAAPACARSSRPASASPAERSRLSKNRGVPAIQRVSLRARKRSNASSAGRRNIESIEKIVESAWTWHQQFPRGYED